MGGGGRFGEPVQACFGAPVGGGGGSPVGGGGRGPGGPGLGGCCLSKGSRKSKTENVNYIFNCKIQ